MEQLITYLEDQLRAWERAIDDPSTPTEELADITARARATSRIIQQVLDDATRAAKDAAP
jgi:hypothetical protein